MLLRNKKILTLMLCFTLTVATILPFSYANSTAFVDKTNAPLADRIEAYIAHTHDLEAQRTALADAREKSMQELTSVQTELARLKRVYATQLYTVLLSAFVDTTTALTLNPLELTLNTALEITEYQRLVSGWSAKTGAERALATQRARDLLANMVPAYENRLNDLKSQEAALEKDYAAALSEIARLKALYKQATKEDYTPQTSALAVPPSKAAAVAAVINAPQKAPVANAPGFTSPQEAAESVYQTIKTNRFATLSQKDKTLPAAQWLALKKVYDKGSGHTRWLGRYQTPMFDPTQVSTWLEKAVPGGQQDVYIEVIQYKVDGQTRYQGSLQKILVPNDPIETTLYTASVTGQLARGQRIVLNNNVVDAQDKLYDTYWYARGKVNGNVKDIYIGKGKSLNTLIPANLYGFDSLVGYSAASIDKYMGKADAFCIVSLNKGINTNYSGINITQLSPATPNKPVVFGGELGLPEYGSVKIVIDYNGKQTTYECVPTKNGAIAYCDFIAAPGVTNGKAKLLIYAGATQIGLVDWSPFTIVFDKNYLTDTQLSGLQSEIGAIRSALGGLDEKIKKLSRVGYAQLLAAYATNASYGTTITEHLKGNKDPNFQYTVQYAMDNDKLLIEYLDGLKSETGKGDQTLVSALKEMKYKGYPQGLAFIDVFYLHLKAAWLSTAAIDALTSDRTQVVSELGKLENQANALLSSNQNSDQVATIQGLIADIQKNIDRVSDGAYASEIIDAAKTETQAALIYLEKQYPEFSGYVSTYSKKGTDAKNIRLIIKGKRVFSSDIATTAVNGRIMVPIRLVAETLNCTVEWREKDQTVIITSAGKISAVSTLPVQNGKGIKVFVDGTSVAFDVAPVVINNRTLVPIRQIAEALGSKVTWDEVNQTAVIE